MASRLRIHMYEGQHIKILDSDNTPQELADWFIEMLGKYEKGDKGLLVETEDEIFGLYPEHISYWEVVSVSETV